MKQQVIGRRKTSLSTGASLVTSGIIAQAAGTSAALNCTGATLLVVNIFGLPTNDTISDSSGNVWTIAPGAYSGTGGTFSTRTTIAYCVNPTVSSSQTFTITATGFSRAIIYAFSGNFNGAVLANSLSTPTGPTLQPGALSMNGGELVVTCIGIENFANPPTLATASINGGFTTPTVDANHGEAASYLLSATTGELNPTWTTTGGGATALCVGSIVAFRPAPVVLPAGITFVQQVNDGLAFTSTEQPTLTTSSSVTKGNLLVAWVTSSSITHAQILSDSHNRWIQFVNQYTEGYGSISAWYAIASQTEILSIQFFDANIIVAGANIGTAGNLNNVCAQLCEFTGNSTVPFVAAAENTGSGTAMTAALSTLLNNSLIWAAGIATSGDYTTIGSGYSDPTAGAHPHSSSQYAQITHPSGNTIPMTQSASAAWGLVAAAFSPQAPTQYQITGNVGVAGAGAIINFTSTTTCYNYMATANGTGNYSSPPMPSDVYLVQPQLVGQTFSFGSQIADNFAGSSLSPLWAIQKGTGLTALAFIVSNGVVESTPTPPNTYATFIQTLHGNGGYITPWNSDQSAQGTVVSTAAGIGLTVRNTPSNTNYLATLTSSTITIYKNTNFVTTSPTSLTSGSYSLQVGDVVEFRCTGTTLAVYVNGVSKLSTTDSTYTFGSPGIYGSGTQLSNFIGINGGVGFPSVLVYLPSISSANNINFTPTTCASPTLTSQVTYSFTQANTSALDPTYWPNDAEGDASIAITSNEGVLSYTVPTANNYSGPWAAGCMNTYLPNGAHAGYVWPKNQYATIQLDHINSAPLAYASAGIGILKTQLLTSGIMAEIFGNADGTVMIIVNTLPWTGSGAEGVGLPYGFNNFVAGYNPTQQPNGSIFRWQPGMVVLQSVPYSAGDTFGIACKSTTYWLLHNGSVIANWTDSTNYDSTGTSPNGGSLLIYGTAATDVKLSNFVGGQVS